MFIVRKPFKSLGHYYPIGMIVTSEDEIKLFKTKCREKKLLPIPSGADFIRLAQYFKAKFGIEIKDQIDAYKERKGLIEAEEDNASQITPPTGTNPPEGSDDSVVDVPGGGDVADAQVTIPVIKPIK